MFKDLDIMFAYQSKQKNGLRNQIDTTESLEKFRIYKIICNDGNEKYYSQSRRAK